MIVYSDLEYMYPGMTTQSGRPTGKNQRQILQVAAILWDDVTGKEVASLDRLVLPLPETTVIPPFMTELTGLTAEQIFTKGVPFADVLAEFQYFCSSYPVRVYLGDYDVWQQNCGYYNLVFPFPEFERVQPLLLNWGVELPSGTSSGTLYQLAGLEMQGHVHNALHDVRSMAAAVHEFQKHKFATTALT